MMVPGNKVVPSDKKAINCCTEKIMSCTGAAPYDVTLAGNDKLLAHVLRNELPN